MQFCQKRGTSGHHRSSTTAGIPAHEDTYGRRRRGVTATLNNDGASRDFAALLPLSLTLNDYARIERIADLPRKLTIEGLLPAGRQNRRHRLLRALGESGDLRRERRVRRGTGAVGQSGVGPARVAATGSIEGQDRAHRGMTVIGSLALSISTLGTTNMSMQSVNGLETAEEQSGVTADRRQFLKIAGVAGAGAVLPLGVASWAGPTAAQPPQSSNGRHHENPETGWLGGVGAWLRVHEHQRQLRSAGGPAQGIRVIRDAYERGVTFFDTAEV